MKKNTKKVLQVESLPDGAVLTHVSGEAAERYWAAVTQKTAELIEPYARARRLSWADADKGFCR